MENKKQDFRASVHENLLENIYPFWLKNSIDDKNGGFWGRMDNNNVVQPNAPKGLILNARLLWSFAAAYNFTRDKELLRLADRAYDYLINNFWDAKHTGFFWMITVDGQPEDDKKKAYGHAFVIYALTEYYMATKKEKALNQAIDIFHLIEEKCRDKEYDGYFEAFERDWALAEDLRLSEIDMNEKKSMNNHLHVLEAYTNLYRVWRDDAIKERLRVNIELFLDKIVNPQTFHFNLFFDEKWTVKSNHISYGHDIEGSWLLFEAAEVLGDADILTRTEKIAIKMAQAVYEQGLDMDGAIFYEADPTKVIDTDKHWWPQAEAMVGFLNAYQLTGEPYFFNASYKSWQFIERFLVDKKNGEWFYMVNKDGEINNNEFKVSEWKSPYHNSRACIEIIKRLTE